MNPKINDTSFGSITVDGFRYDHDVLITLEGKIKKRKKKLSKMVYGSSHRISLNEISYCYQNQTEAMVIGSGQHGMAEISDEAKEFLQERNCRVILKPTPEAIQVWNTSEGKWIGLFHITC